MILGAQVSPHKTLYKTVIFSGNNTNKREQNRAYRALKHLERCAGVSRVGKMIEANGRIFSAALCLTYILWDIFCFLILVFKDAFECHK